MKPAMIILLLILAPSIFAGESIILSPINIQISSEDALSKFDKTLLYPEGLLRRFRPTGAVISNKNVSQNVINFVATKTVLFISKSVYVNGTLDTTIDNHFCSKGDFGYNLKMRFDSSENLVTDNVEELQAMICLHSLSDSKLTAVVHPSIVTGNNYSKIVGPMAVNLITEQVAPLISALTDEIKSLR